MNPEPDQRPVVVVTGLSGAGKASVLRVLEDLGYETVDNPPLNILDALVDGAGAQAAGHPTPLAAGHPTPLAAGHPTPLAAGIDARTRGFAPEEALAAMARLRARPDVAAALIFLTATDPALLRRFTETRRRHPLASGGPLGSGVADGIARERTLLAPLRDAADLVIDTTELPLPELRQAIERRFRPADGAPGLGILVQSFGFPRGLPPEADLVFDLRFLRNPHYVDALRPGTGRDADVAAYVAADPEFMPFWDRLVGFVIPLLPRFVAEGKKYLTIALGCTGGRHRSVLVAERLVAHLRDLGWRAEVSHRELASEARAEGREALSLPP